MHSATIPLAAMATFAAVYWFTPAPAVVRAPPPARIAEPAAPGSAAPGVLRSSVVPAANRAQLPRRRAARPRPAVAASAHAFPAPRARAVAVYFPGCNAVRAAGLAPLLRGEPGYRPEMDGDDDGIACEPHRGRRGY
jgi:hypothetical protein